MYKLHLPSYSCFERGSVEHLIPCIITRKPNIDHGFISVVGDAKTTAGSSVMVAAHGMNLIFE